MIQALCLRSRAWDQLGAQGWTLGPWSVKFNTIQCLALPRTPLDLSNLWLLSQPVWC